MARLHNTDRNGNAWSEQTKLAVWAKGTPVAGSLESARRRDKCGKLIRYVDHGDRKSDTGWEIDHIDPVSNGGGDELKNLQPLHWSNNAGKGDDQDWSCP